MIGFAVSPCPAFENLVRSFSMQSHFNDLILSLRNLIGDKCTSKSRKRPTYMFIIRVVSNQYQ
jgi:hypothetical protein